MRHSQRRLILCVLVITAMGTIGTYVWSRESSAAQKSQIQWQQSLQEMHRVSISTGKPMLIVFSSVNCGPCRQLERDVFGDAATANYINSKFVTIHLDVNKDAQEAKILDVTMVPACYILNPKADLLGSIVGYVDKGRFRNTLSQAIEVGEAKKLARK